MDHTHPFHVRPGTSHDYSRLSAIFDEAEAFHREALPHVFRQPAERFPSPALYNGLVLDRDSDVLVAEAGTELIGFVTVRIDTAPDEPILQPRRFAMVDMLAVRSDRRRQGIGGELMEAAHQWARDRDLHDIALNVWEFNQRAIRFYQALGYQSVSRLMERRDV